MQIYTESEKRTAIRAYVMYGTYELAGKAVGIPWQTIAAWKHADPVWWDEKLAEVQLAVLKELGESHRNELLECKAMIIRQMKQRLATGNQKMNQKTGELVRVEIDLKELTGALPIVGAALGAAEKDDAPRRADERQAEFERIAQEERAGRMN